MKRLSLFAIIGLILASVAMTSCKDNKASVIISSTSEEFDCIEPFEKSIRLTTEDTSWNISNTNDWFTATKVSNSEIKIKIKADNMTKTDLIGSFKVIGNNINPIEIAIKQYGLPELEDINRNQASDAAHQYIFYNVQVNGQSQNSWRTHITEYDRVDEDETFMNKLLRINTIGEGSHTSWLYVDYLESGEMKVNLELPVVKGKVTPPGETEGYDAVGYIRATYSTGGGNFTVIEDFQPKVFWRETKKQLVISDTYEVEGYDLPVYVGAVAYRVEDGTEVEEISFTNFYRDMIFTFDS